MSGHDVAERAAVQPVVVGQVRSDQAAEVGAVAREAEVGLALEDRLALREAVGDRSAARRPRRAAGGRRAAGAPRPSTSAWYSATMPACRRAASAARGSSRGTTTANDDREVEAVQPPARQRVVELADAVGFVIEQLVALRSRCLVAARRCPSPSASRSSSSGSAAQLLTRARSIRGDQTSTTLKNDDEQQSDTHGKMPMPAMLRRISRVHQRPPRREPTGGGRVSGRRAP